MGCGTSSEKIVGSTQALQQAEMDREQARLAAIPPIGLTVQMEEGPDRLISVKPWEPALASLERELDLVPDDLVRREVWLGDVRLASAESWESQGVVDGATIKTAETRKGLLIVADAHRGELEVFRADDCSLAVSIGTGNCPCGVAVDGQGLLVVADSNDHRVRALRGCDQTSCAVAWTRPTPWHLRPREIPPNLWDGRGVEFDNPSGVAVDLWNGRVVVADSGNHCLQMLRLEDGSHVQTIGGSRGNGAGEFNNPSAVAVDQGEGCLVVADTFNHRVQVLRLEDGSHIRTIGRQGSGDGQFSSPFGVAVDHQGNLLVADSGNHRVQVLRIADGSHVRTIGRPGTLPGMFDYPCGVAADGRGNVVVADTNNRRVQVLRQEDGSHISTIGPRIVGSHYRRAVRRSNISAEYSYSSGVEFRRPFGVAIDTGGQLLAPRSVSEGVTIEPYNFHSKTGNSQERLPTDLHSQLRGFQAYTRAQRAIHTGFR